MFARVLITSFMCLLSLMIAISLYQYYQSSTEETAIYYKLLAVTIGLVIPSVWLFLYEYTSLLTGALMGLFGLVYGFLHITWPSFFWLFSIVTIYSLAIYLDKKYQILSYALIDVLLAWTLLWCIFYVLNEHFILVFIFGGGFALILSLNFLLLRLNPSLAGRLGIKYIQKQQCPDKKI